MPGIKDYLRETRTQGIEHTLEEHIKSLNEEGFSVEFGNIGLRTTYALLYTKDHEREVVGYTFVKDIKFYKESVGKLKALEQAIARKELTA